VTIPCGQIDRFSYEYTKKHRVTEGAIVMVASLGAGAIVMLTKSKSHWLYIDFHEQSSAKSLVLRMDKNEYKKIFEAIQTHTGKEVQFVGEAEKSKKH
jgi:hydrogenase maturation factor